MGNKERIQKAKKEIGALLNISDGSCVDLIISYLTEYNPYQKTSEVKQWLQDINSKSYFNVNPIKFSEMKNWHFDEKTGDLVHNLGAFFKIRGLNVKTNIGVVQEWSQPIIYQPEIGLLGIITKKIDGILYFLVQAKAEPGNINTFQLSPSVQATRSNFKRVHGGKSTLFLEYFEGGCPERKKFILDQLQSEQGARFYKKRNRNCIIELNEDVEPESTEYFKWLTFGQIVSLMKSDNTVNMDLRSVLSSLSLGDLSASNDMKGVSLDKLGESLESLDIPDLIIDIHKRDIIYSSNHSGYCKYSNSEILHRLSQRRFDYEVEAELLPLNEVNSWNITDTEISHEDNKFFKIFPVEVEANSREVAAWDQPIVQQYDPGIAGMISKRFNGVLHFLCQMKMESGNLDVLEFAPTVQCLTGSYDESTELPFVKYFTNQKFKEHFIHESLQSEEGGRFYREENKNIILDGDSLDFEEGQDYIWMSLAQLKYFIQFNNYLNVETRSTISLL